MRQRWVECRTVSSDIKLVAIDLDGTLLNDAKEVTQRTVASLARLEPRGVHVVIASARPPRSVRHIYRRLRLTTLQVNYNGALIWDESTRQAFYHQPLAGEVVRQIVIEARRRHPELLVSSEILDRWYTDNFDREFARQFGPESSRMFEPDVIAPVETFYAMAATKLLLLGSQTIIEPLGRLVADQWASSASVIHIDQGLLQIMDRRCSKAAAVRMVAQHYGLEMSQVMAIGDARNDVPMLEAAGVAVAMDNAHPDTKAVADWIAPSNNDHGVCAALQKYGLADR